MALALTEKCWCKFKGYRNQVERFRIRRKVRSVSSIKSKTTYLSEQQMCGPRERMNGYILNGDLKKILKKRTQKIEQNFVSL